MFQRTKRLPLLLGPAFVAAIAYVDPGNVATNMTAGSTFGFTLVWVVLLANAMAVLVQYLSAKLGIVTGASLPTHLGQRLGRRGRIAYWLQAELVAVATDIAEVIGGAVALYLLFGLPLIVGALVTAVVSLVVLLVGDRWGQSTLERVVMFLLLVIAVGFTAGLFVEAPTAAQVASGLVPTFAGTQSVLLASGIIGATVMPHVVYLHSGLTAPRLGARAAGVSIRRLLTITRWDVALALVVAGVINLALLLVGATSLDGLPGTDSLVGIYDLLGRQLGVTVAVLFAVGLLVSGFASTAVGAAAGAEIMQGLLHRRVPVVLRRAVTVIPALVVLGSGLEPGRALVLSQVVLSIGIPAALIPLVSLTANRDVMGVQVNRRPTTYLAVVIVVLVITLNVALLYLTLIA